MTVKLEVDTKQLTEGLTSLKAGLEQLSKPQALEQISRAIFAITGERFMVDIDSYARRNPKKMHHIYEWGRVGDRNARLFVLERTSVLDGSLLITTNFLQSKMPVPINPELLSPGKTGKVVSRSSVFANKAQVMENGTPVSFNAKRVLAMIGSSGLAFIAPGTQINILHPGGVQTKNAFATYLLDWYTNTGSIVLDSSGLYERISNDISKALSLKNGNASSVQKALTLIADQIDVGGIIK
jgi:hypothetical protein